MCTRGTLAREQQVITLLPLPVHTPEQALNLFIANDIRKWTDALIPQAAARIQDIMTDITRDEIAADRQPTAHRWSRLCRITTHHVTIGFEEYTAPVQAALRAGYTIIFNHQEQASL